MILADDPRRRDLNDEVHARPPEPLTAPCRISFVAMVSEWENGAAERAALAALAEAHGVAPPRPGVTHFSADFGTFRLRWERHTEFARYQVVVPGAGEDPFADPAMTRVPADWLATLPGKVIAAANVGLVRGSGAPPDPDRVSAELFDGNLLVGAEVAGGAASAFTDFRIRPDGFSRLLLVDVSMSARQAGRTVQRLLEIDTYRMMAFLALPVARDLSPFIGRCEKVLGDITGRLAEATEADEPRILERLTRLEADISNRVAASHYRFSAAKAYYELVRNRIAELREVRIEGLQTFREFTERRLAPAMNTCLAVSARQEALSERVARASQFLATRVDLTRERQNQALLASMDRRASLQLRLQETVEGLSIAAVTYYVVGLIGYAAKGIGAFGVAISPELVMGLSIPLVLLATAAGLRRIRAGFGHTAEHGR
jgi:uncharacterized membrane-anchored protein